MRPSSFTSPTDEDVPSSISYVRMEGKGGALRYPSSLGRGSGAKHGGRYTFPPINKGERRILSSRKEGRPIYRSDGGERSDGSEKEGPERNKIHN